MRRRGRAVMGGLVTSSLFTLLALPSFYKLAHKLAQRFGRDRDAPASPTVHGVPPIGV